MLQQQNTAPAAPSSGDELAAMSIEIAELKRAVSDATSTIAGLTLHVAQIDDQISLSEFIHPRNTIPAPHTVSSSPPIELSNQFEVLHIEETVESEEVVDSPGSSETSVHSSLPISEQLKAYARKQKANHEQRKAAPHHSLPSPQSTLQNQRNPCQSTELQHHRIPAPTLQQSELFA